MLEQVPLTQRTVSVVGRAELVDEHGVPLVPFATIPALLLGSLVDRGDVIEQGFLVHDEERDKLFGLEPGPLPIDPERDDDTLDWEARGDIVAEAIRAAVRRAPHFKCCRARDTA